MSSATPNYDIVKELLEEFNVHNYTESKLSRIRALYCKGKSSDKRTEIFCTDDEFYQFMYFVLKFKLDPLQGYIQCIKYSDNVPAQIFLGKDALIALVSREQTFLGMKSGIFYRKPSEMIYSKIKSELIDGNELNQETNDNIEELSNENPVKNDSYKLYGYAKIYRNDRTVPIYVECSLTEYHRGNETWNLRPETMIKKVAISQACEMAYPEIFAGMYLSEEFYLSEQEVFRPAVVNPEPIQIENPPVYKRVKLDTTVKSESATGPVTGPATEPEITSTVIGPSSVSSTNETVNVKEFKPVKQNTQENPESVLKKKLGF